jgi:hypothetical protein
MIIESERDEPVHDDQQFDYQVPLAEVEHVPQQFTIFIHMHQEIRDAGVHAQLQRIWLRILWARRGASKNT